MRVHGTWYLQTEDGQGKSKCKFKSVGFTYNDFQNLNVKCCTEGFAPETLCSRNRRHHFGIIAAVPFKCVITCVIKVSAAQFNRHCITVEVLSR